MKKIYGFDLAKKNILDNFLNNKLHHCTLLNGIKGCGKSSFLYNDIVNFILSESNSINKIDIDEEILKKTSKLIEGGGHTDLLILNINTTDEDGKSNLSKKGEINVDQTRKIINNIKLTSSISKNKVLVVDSIDTLNINAQNALLKTLEEPPENTFIFLICHDLNKVIPTIKSRSNLINVPTLSMEDWANALFSDENIQTIEINDEEIADLYNISNASVGFAIDILQNDLLNLYDKLLQLLLDKNIIEIQKFSNDFTDQNKFDLFGIFFEKILMDVINYKISGNSNSFIEKRKNLFDIIVKRNTFDNMLNYIDYLNKMIIDVDKYNLDKKQSINILINKIKL